MIAMSMNWRGTYLSDDHDEDDDGAAAAVSTRIRGGYKSSYV